MSLNHAVTSDGYSDAATDSGPRTGVTVLVFNNPVIAQLAKGNPPYYDASLEHEIPNGSSITFDEPCSGIRFRSAVAGQPGQVTTIPGFE